jgi:hypothetical protein
MLYSFVKNWVLQTYPLKMNLDPEIRMDRKRNFEILPSTLPLFAKLLLFWYGDSIASYTS